MSTPKKLADDIRNLRAYCPAEVAGQLERLAAIDAAGEADKSALKARPSKLDIRVDKSGLYVGGQRLYGMLKWEILSTPAEGLTEVCVLLCADKLTVDLEAPAGRIL